MLSILALEDEKLWEETSQTQDLTWVSHQEYHQLLDWRRKGIEDARAALRVLSMRDCLNNVDASVKDMMISAVDQTNPFKCLSKPPLDFLSGLRLAASKHCQCKACFLGFGSRAHLEDQAIRSSLLNVFQGLLSDVYDIHSRSGIVQLMVHTHRPRTLPYQGTSATKVRG